MKRSVKITHSVPVLDRPVTGFACYRKGKLVYVTAGEREVNGRLSNYFYWRIVQKDGTLGRKLHGYW